MISKYTYKGLDITLDVYDKIRSVSEILQLKFGGSFEDNLSSFLASKTYTALANPKTLMWSESVPFIVDEYLMEIA